jgi:hypothetical protein
MWGAKDQRNLAIHTLFLVFAQPKEKLPLLQM